MTIKINAAGAFVTLHGERVEFSMSHNHKDLGIICQLMKERITPKDDPVEVGE